MRRSQVLAREEYYSIGGGFVVQAGAEAGAGDSARRAAATNSIPARACSNIGAPAGIGNSRTDAGARAHLVQRRRHSRAARCASGRSCRIACAAASRPQGLLPGVLGVRRRAPKLYRQLMSGDPSSPMHALDWVNAFALAVNEENAAGGQVVTAPTNGAAGIVPAVLHYYRRFEAGRGRRRRDALSAHRRRDGHALQAKRVDLRRRDGLPGRGRRRLLDGGGRTGVGAATAATNRSKMPRRSAWNTISA